MNKYIKKISIAFVILISLVFNVKNVSAATGSVSLSASSTNTYIGNTITVTVTVSESAGKLGSWSYEISHDSSKLTLIDGSEGMYGEVGDGSITSKTYTLKYKAISSGSTTISVSYANILDWDSEQSINVTKGSIAVNISSSSSSSTATTTKSSDNNLKSLSIDGLALSPDFTEDTLEYSVTLASGTTKINVNAQSSDSKSTISGIGEVEVKEGQNKIEIVVTAENGSTKTYVINAIVEEEDPIIVKISGEEYTVVRNLDDIEVPEYFSEQTVIINSEEVTGYYNEITGFTIVPLMDSEGNIKFFIYDTTKFTFSKFICISTSELSVIVIDLEKSVDIPHRYYKANFTYNDDEVEAYAFDENTDFRVVYGINVETGEKGLYLYDMKDNTIQRFYNDQVNVYVELVQKCKIAFIIAGSVMIILTIIIIILLSKNVKFKTKYLNKKLNPIDNPKYYDKNVKYQDLEGTSMIDKIEDDKNTKTKKSKKTFLDE